MNSVMTRLRSNAWPIGIVLVVLAFVSIDGALILTAFRDKTIAPEEGYYEKALDFDRGRAPVLRSTDAGWKAAVAVADAPLPGMPRRVDVVVRDGQGNPVTGLVGTLTAVRPADARLSNSGSLLEVPGEQGAYRLLLKVPARGLWEFQLDARKGADQYRLIIRQEVAL
jgi:hypothetical protein